MKFFATICVALFLSTGCNHQDNKSESTGTTTAPMLALDSTGTAAEADQEQAPPQQPAPGTTTNAAGGEKEVPLPVERKIIKTANLTLEVKRIVDFQRSLTPKFKKYGAYTSSEENSFADDRSEILLTIKVPVQSFEMLMNDLNSGDGKITERSVHSEDVTAQFVDTKTRLETRKKLRLKYLEFLQQAKNMTEALQVQAEINTIQEEIEAAEGKIQFLSAQAAYSTINLRLVEPTPGYVYRDKSPSFFVSLLDAFINGGLFLKTIVIGLISIWPLLIILLLLYVFVQRRRKASRSIKNSA